METKFDATFELLSAEADGKAFRVNYSNLGDPYREGLDFSIEEYKKSAHVMLEDSECIELRNFLMGRYPFNQHEAKRVLMDIRKRFPGLHRPW